VIGGSACSGGLISRNLWPSAATAYDFMCATWAVPQSPSVGNWVRNNGMGGIDVDRGVAAHGCGHQLFVRTER